MAVSINVTEFDAIDTTASIFPSASHTCSTVPKLDTGTTYEYGLVYSVTRKYFASGDASTAVISDGWPIFFTALVFTSISASWPIV